MKSFGPGSRDKHPYPDGKIREFVCQHVVPIRINKEKGNMRTIMQNTLRKLFDYQKFVKNSDLQAAIDSVHKRPRELTLDETEWVSAAGAPYYKPAVEDEKDNRL